MTKLNIPLEFNVRHMSGINKMKRKISNIIQKGSTDDILHWEGRDVIFDLFYLYLFKKYKQTCVPTGNTGTFNDIGLGIILNLKKNLNFIVDKDINEEQYGSEIYNIKHRLNEYSSIISHCIQNLNSKKNIVIPVNLILSHSRHANILIYNKLFNTLSLYEPHGIFIMENNELKHKLFAYLTKRINRQLGFVNSNRIKYEEENVICPFGIKGFQKMEEEEALQKELRESEGYCVVWSLFFTEMTLANPDMSSRDLFNNILSYITEVSGNGNEGLFLRFVARGYVKIINEKLKLYFNELYDVDVSNITDYVKFIKTLSKKMLDKYTFITRAYISLEYELQFISIDDLYNADANLGEDFFNNLNDDDNILIRHKLIQKIYNKEIARTPSSSQSISYSDNIEDANELIKDQINGIIPDTHKRKRKPCNPGKVRNTSGRCVKKTIMKTKKGNIKTTVKKRTITRKK